MCRTWSGVTTPGAGSTDKVMVSGHTGINNVTAITIAMWMYRTGAGGSSGGRMAHKGTGAGQQEWAWLDSGAVASFSANRWPTAGQWTWTTTTANVWIHIAITYSFSSTANDPIMYINGAVNTGFTESVTPSGSIASPTSADLAIGNDPTGIRAFAGRLMHFGYWNRILTISEIKGVMKAGPLRHASGLVTYLPLMGTDSPEPNYAPQGDATRNGVVTGTTTGGKNDFPGTVLVGAY